MINKSILQDDEHYIYNAKIQDAKIDRTKG